MAQIILSCGCIVELDDEDLPLVQGYTWTRFRPLSGRGRQFYAITNGGTLLMHRLILDAPTGIDIDHRDGNGLNNRRSNLRLATKAQNQWNRPRSRVNTSGYTGVFRGYGGRYFSAIVTNKKRTHLGYFASPAEAAKAYDRAAIAQRGDFARTNFPRETYLEVA